MKPLLLFFMLLLITACADKEKTTPATPVKQVTIPNPFNELRASLGEPYFIKEISKPANVTALPFEKLPQDSTGSVSLKADNGKSVVFEKYVNTEDESEGYTYILHGLEPKTGLYWVEQQLWEEQKHLLVRKTDGSTYEIANEPFISTNGNYLFVKQNGCFRMFDDCPTGFSVYALHRGGFEVFCVAKLKNYYVDRGGWLPKGELFICLKSLGANREKEYYYEISPKGGFAK